LLETTREQIATAPIEKLMKEVVPFAEVDPVDDLEEALRQVLAGRCCSWSTESAGPAHRHPGIPGA